MDVLARSLSPQVLGSNPRGRTKLAGQTRMRPVYRRRRAAAAELARLVEATAPSPGDRRAATTMTFAELLDAWWETKRPTLAASTPREYQRIIDTRLKPRPDRQ